MAAAVSRAVQLQAAFVAGGLQGVFVEQLGWGSPSGKQPIIDVNGFSGTASTIADLKGFNVYAIKCVERPSRQVMRLVDKSLSQFAPERLEIFEGPEQWLWYWPRRSSSGTTTFESVETAPDTLPSFLAQRLTGLEFTVADHLRGLTLAEVRDRVHGHFDASNVTAKFYEKFADEQAILTLAVEGIPVADRYSYSTTLLNRLMFLYFMQKKELLNGDSRYLENTLAAVQRLRGQNQYHSFYRDALLPLFFEKFNKRDQEVADPEIAEILGDVPYVNGGIFGRTDLESTYGGDILVPDAAFSRILQFFGEFNWHLDTRPTGNPNEINPEVIGYIFEQFINVASSGQRENGAYYTPHDVTSYMVAQTVVPRILDGLDETVRLFEALRADPARFIQPLMLHGFDHRANDWLEVPSYLTDNWLNDPAKWQALDDEPADRLVNLPGESWVETFHRRERVDAFKARVLADEINSVNDLISNNVNAQLLLTDVLDRLTDGSRISQVFKMLSSLTVFDPTCGSGAFLFAALEVLEDVYAHLIDAARACGDSDIAELLAQVDACPSERYFIRRHIAIRNLYGTDLMSGAIETAKLRIFLALAACVDSRIDLQPLPDLDFNLKVGNLVVGFKDRADAEERLNADFVTAAYLRNLGPKIQEYSELYKEFVTAVEDLTPGQIERKYALRQSEDKLRAECNDVYARLVGIPEADFEEWVQRARPFHWFCEFPEIIERGGFDVVIGNPPYVKRKDVAGYTITGYSTVDTPDLYAPCYERSLSLTSPSGRHAFIVMSSLSFGERFAALRGVIGARRGAEWWSTYGKIPSPLFKGVRVRNTILVLGPGEGVCTTRHHIHTAAQRDWLFPTIEYSRSSRASTDWPVRGGVATRALELMRSAAPVEGSLSGEIVFLRRSASYWFPALLGPAPVFNADWTLFEALDALLREVTLRTPEASDDVKAMLGGKLAYLWWTAIGDDFNVNPREADVPRAVAVVAGGLLGWSKAVSDVLQAGRHVTYVSLNRRWYFNVRWNNVRGVTDALDKLALAASGGDESDWRDINVLYRQVMRSSGDSSKGRYVTPQEYDDVLGWE